MQIKVSVIVPVYNTGELLRPCLDSLMRQSLSQIEFILVDDGSTDDSGTICDEYAVKDSRFRVVHKKNAGVSRARNDGIRLAQGEYIGFVDSDDTVREDMFLRLFRLAKENSADIVLCDSVAVKGGRTVASETFLSLPESILLTRQDISPDVLLEIAGSACRCIYRRDLLNRNSILFPLDLKFSEDRIFNLCAMGAAERIYYAKEAFYNRLLHTASAVHKFYPNYFEIVKDAAARTHEAIRQFWDGDPALQTAYLQQFIGGSIAAINNYFYKTATISRREARKKVRGVCEDTSLRDAITQSGYGGIRGTWILKKRVWMLSLCAMYLNRKYGR